MKRYHTRYGIERGRKKKKGENPAVRVRRWCRLVSLPSAWFRCTRGRMLDVRQRDMPRSVGAVTERSGESTEVHHSGPEGIRPPGAPKVGSGAPGDVATGAGLRR